MVIVHLEDGTQFLIDTDIRSEAVYYVNDRLRKIGDYRKVKSSQVFEKVTLEKSNKHYNGVGEDVLLKAFKGYSCVHEKSLYFKDLL